MLLKLPTLVLLGAATVAQAQLGNFFRKIIGNTQETFVESVATHNSHILTSENWLNTINATNPLLPTSEEPQEWLLYFTASEDVSTARNVSMWDEIYNDVVVKLTALKKSVHFGKVDYSAPEARELCQRFMLTDSAIPSIYHAAQYPINGSIVLRPYLGTWNTTIEEKKDHLVKFFTEQQWKDVKPWNGVFNPVDGQLKTAGPYVGMMKKYYDMVPQWLLMIVISLVGRHFTTRVVTRATQRPRDAPPTAT